MSNTNTSWGQQGWICPKCGCVWAPHVDGCYKCNNGNNNTAGGTGIISTEPDWTYNPLTDPVKWGYDTSISGQKPLFEGQPAIITNAYNIVEYFEKTEIINEDTINAYFNKE